MRCGGLRWGWGSPASEYRSMGCSFAASRWGLGAQFPAPLSGALQWTYSLGSTRDHLAWLTPVVLVGV